MSDEGRVFRLPDELVAAPEPPKPSAPGRLHGMAIFGMAACAVLGTLSMFAFITIGWPGTTGHIVVTTFVFCVVGFITCASAAIFTAARDTYPRKSPSEDVES